VVVGCEGPRVGGPRVGRSCRRCFVRVVHCSFIRFVAASPLLLLLPSLLQSRALSLLHRSNSSPYVPYHSFSLSLPRYRTDG